MHEVTDDEKFLFDLQGYLILHGAIDRDLIHAIDRAVVENEAIDHDESWADGLPVVTAAHFIKDTWVEHQIRLNGLPRLDPVFDELIAHPALMPYLTEFMGEPQLVNTWSISKYEGRGASRLAPRHPDRAVHRARRRHSIDHGERRHHADPESPRRRVLHRDTRLAQEEPRARSSAGGPPGSIPPRRSRSPAIRVT